MKSLSFIAVLVCSLLISQFSFAQKSLKKETVKVWGNCDMCKKTIEKAAKSAGASSADWNEETKQLIVFYEASKISNQKIQQAIAEAGYDTENFTANDAAYDKLHACCKYDRKDPGSSNSKSCCENANCKSDTGSCKDMTCCKEDTGKEKSCCKM